VLSWLVALAAIVLLAAALAAPVQDLLARLELREARPGREVHEFLKVFRRLLLVPLVVLLFVRLRPWRDGIGVVAGLRGRHARLSMMPVAFLLTLLLGIGLLGVHAALGGLGPRPRLDFEDVGPRLLTRLGSAVGVAVLEEWFFRGWLFHRFGARLGAARAALAVATIFALVHAFRPATLRVEVSRDFRGALEALAAWTETAVDPERFGPSFVGLALFSLVLSASFLRTRTLWTAIGIHAAGAFLVYAHEMISRRAPLPEWAGTRLLFDGAPACLIMVVALWGLWPRGAGTRERLGGEAPP
jgi:membrane protease YdiL (CAAX protease family)